MKTQLVLDDDWFAIGVSTDEPERFQGFHAEELLVVMDEAPGIGKESGRRLRAWRVPRVQKSWR